MNLIDEFRIVHCGLFLCYALMQLFEKKKALVLRGKVRYLVENLVCKKHLTASEVNNAKLNVQMF